MAGNRLFLRGPTTINEVEVASSSPSTSISGIFYAQFSMRNRTLTEDTVLAWNHKEDSTEVNEKATVNGNENDASVDEASTISSVTDTSFRNRPKKRPNREDPSFAFPPKEITVLFAKPFEETLTRRPNIPLPRPSPISTSVGSPRLRRPSAPRSLTNNDSRLSLIPETPSIRSLGCHSEAESSIADSQLLGNRPKFYPRQTSQATAVSVGSFVGQSCGFDPSIITAPETSCSSSEFSMRRSLPSLNSGSLADSSRSPTTRPQTRIISHTARRVMKKELKQMLNRVATPLRRLGKTEETTDLQRAKGFLT